MRRSAVVQVQHRRKLVLDSDGHRVVAERNRNVISFDEDESMALQETIQRPRLRLGEAFGGLSRRIAQYKTYTRTLDELSQLDDRELADLGLHRSMIRGIAYRAAYDG